MFTTETMLEKKLAHLDDNGKFEWTNPERIINLDETALETDNGKSKAKVITTNINVDQASGKVGTKPHAQGSHWQ